MRSILTYLDAPASVYETHKLINLCMFLQVDNVSLPQKKAFGLALSIILTLRLPQVLDKLDQILRYELNLNFDS